MPRSVTIEAEFALGIPRTVNVPTQESLEAVPRRHLISERRKTGKEEENTGMTTDERNQRAEMPMPDTGSIGSIDLMRQDKYSNNRC